MLHKYHNVAEMCQITKKPQYFRGKSVEKISKNRIKLNLDTFDTFLFKKRDRVNH